MHALAAWAAAVADLPVVFRAGLGMALLASLLGSLREAGWLHSQLRLQALRLHPDNTLAVHDGSGWHEAKARTSSRVNAHFILLHARTADGRVWHQAILPDSLDAEAYRRLSVGLRWYRPAPEADGVADGTVA